MNDKKFKCAVCQHPMYFIIKEDSTSNERTPPWGAESIGDYYKKIVKNLEYVEKNEKVKVDFEFSAYEFLDLLKDFPEIRQKFKLLLKKGKIGFVNGTYGQPHLQILTSESAFRQFELGLKTYKKMVGKQVRVFAAQEAGLFDQLPQILKSFNYMVAVLPSFCYSITFLDPYELVAFMESADMKVTDLGFEDYLIDRLDFDNDKEFGSWLGPDGTIFPLYLTDCQAQCRDKDIINERKRDLFHAPSIRIQSPDLLDFQDKIVEKVTKNSDFVVLEDALKERLDRSVLSGRVLVKSYHSYLEGVDGDKVNLVNRELENRILITEFMDYFKCILYKKEVPDKNTPRIDLSSSWEVLLRCQHHDVYYPSAPELRQKAINWMGMEIKKINIKNQNIIKDINKILGCREIEINNSVEEKLEKNLLKINVFNAYPKKRKDIVKVPDFPISKMGEGFKISDNDGKNVEWQEIHEETGKSGQNPGISFIAEINGMGMTQYSLKKSTTKNNDNRPEKPMETAGIKKLTSSFSFENNFYRTVINKNCEIKSLKLKNDNFELIAKNSYGNQIIANRGINDKKLIVPEFYNSEIRKGLVFTEVVSYGKFDKSDCKIRIFFYKELSRIDFKIEFDFLDQTLGDFYSDESKLNIVWPFSFKGELFHDSPFGVSKSAFLRPVFAINWIKYTGGKASVVLLNEGKIKYFGKNNSINQVLAWGSGETRDYIRMGGEDILSKPFEFKLNGKVNFNYSLLIEEKSNSFGEYFLESSKIQMPFFAELIESKENSGNLKFFDIKNSNIIPTSITNNNDSYLLKFFECDGEKSNLDILKDNSIIIDHIETIDGKEVKSIDPYKIGNIKIVI